MVKLYRGEIKKNPEEKCLFMLDASAPSKILVQLMDKHAKDLTFVDFSLLDNKYYFFINHFPSLDYPVLKLLDELEKYFPQIIWTKIIENETGYYKVEFIPISFKLDREGEDGNLASCLEEMGYHAQNLVPTFRSKFEEIFVNCSKCFSLEDNLNWNKAIPSAHENSTSYHSTELEEDDLLLRLNNLQYQLQKKIKLQEQNTTNEVGGTIDEGANKKFKGSHRRKNSSNKNWRLIVSIVSLLLIILTVLGQFYYPAIVQGESMEPTLTNKSFVILEKKPETIKRGDIISFEVQSSGQREFIKRVIGLPGDEIYATNGNLYVNGKKIEPLYDNQNTSDFDLREISGCDKVPEGKVFVLGDNRTNSTDSRSFGFVSYNQIMGKVL